MRPARSVVSVMTILLAALPALSGCASAHVAKKKHTVKRPTLKIERPKHTFSIVARDPNTGQLGVAVQSHWFNVGNGVPWAEAGVGAVATQAFGDPSYGALGLELMRAGKPAPAALRGLVATDASASKRQVGMIDAQGRVAAYTGDQCIAAAGHLVDEAGQFAVQANLMESDAVWPAMAAAYRQAPGDLAERLLAALAAGQRAGGDIRGQQSAAIIVVAAHATGQPWRDRLIDLRVEDHPEPIAELQRLVRIQRAYDHMSAGDEALAREATADAEREYSAARALAPEIPELQFWQAVALAQSGRPEAALPLFRAVFVREPRWRPVPERLARVRLFPNDPQLLAQLAALAPTSQPAP